MTLSDLTNLDFSNTGSWPPLAKAIAIIVVIAVVGGAGYWFFTQDQLENLDKVHRVEQDLRQEFTRKQQVMANIEAVRAQIDKMQQDLNKMIKELPTRTEMPDLLENISNTGVRNGLDFELFQPQPEQRQEFYAAKPIVIKARATYHQFGAFISSISALSRIVTLEKANLAEMEQQKKQQGRQTSAAPGGDQKPLLIDATLQTYRYLEESEMTDAAQGKSGNQGAQKR